MSDPVYDLQDVTLSLKGNAGTVDILRGISLQVQQGESIALTGASGSGKSSLLMVMGGLERATGGTVMALGHDLSALREDGLAQFRQGRMGIVFQSFHLIPTMTALENVATPLELSGADDAFDRARASWRPWALAIASTNTLRRCRAANSSVWPSPAPLHHVRRSCWRMSRQGASTAATAPRSWICCLSCATAMARRWCW